MMTVKTVRIEVALLISHKDEKISLFSEDQLKSVRKSSLTPVFNWKSALKFFPTMTVKTVCIEVALLFSHKDEKTSLFSEDKLKRVRKSPLTPVFRWKTALKFFPRMTVKIVCIEVALLISHKDGKTSLFSEEKLESVRKNSLTPVFRWKAALKFFAMMTVKTVCIEVALSISHRAEKTSLFSDDQLKSVRKSSLTPVFNWKSALKFFLTMTVKTVCIEVALLISHKDEKFSLFSVDQLKCVRKSSLTPVFERKSALKIFPMVTVNIICIEVALLFTHKDGKNSLFSEEKLECVRKNSLTPVFKWKSALKFFPLVTVKTFCLEVAHLLSHKDGKTSLFSEDKLKSVRKSPLTPVLRWKSALRIFPMTTVKTVCIEVALLIRQKDGKTSLFSEEKLESVRKNSLTPVFKWESALKVFPMMTVKTVCIEVATLFSHKDQKTSLFSEDQKKCKKKSSHSRI